MRITYYALRAMTVGDEVRQPGDLVPEANNWPHLSGYVSEGKIAPVLVVTLPEEAQVMLLEWEQDQSAPVADQPAADKSVTKTREKEKV